MVERVYGHLGDVRQRAEVVEFHVGDHEDRLEDRLRALREANRREAVRPARLANDS